MMETIGLKWRWLIPSNGVRWILGGMLKLLYRTLDCDIKHEYDVLNVSRYVGVNVMEILYLKHKLM